LKDIEVILFLKLSYSAISFSELLQLFSIAKTERYIDQGYLKGFVSLDYNVDNSADKDERYRVVVESNLLYWK
jgi:hypothetical protein